MENKGKTLNSKESGNKVYVGLSGGVDSSVSAALLKSQGYDVTGVFIKVWQPEFVECEWREDRLDAMRVCAHLGIPFLDLDLEEEYKKEVFDYMIKEYKEGRTPNPDVMCNKSIKFGGFLKFALKNGADFVATGHYAQIKKEGSRLLHSVRKDEFSVGKFVNDLPGVNRLHERSEVIQKIKMLEGKDNNKDQTYFLWTLTQEQLKYVLFPIGHLEKPKVRKLAEKFGLLTAEKKDSQGLCFVGMVDMRDFLKRFLPEKQGDVLNEKGEVIGNHEGSYYYTYGQRHGFTITEKTPDDKPRFVVAKDVEKNTITVSDKFNEKNIYDKNEIEIENINWISGEEPDFEKTYQARIRYRQPLQSCKIHGSKASVDLKVVFDDAQKAVSAGQSIVFYDGEECLGGAIIK